MGGARGGREGGRKRWCEAGREREWRKGWRVEGGGLIRDRARKGRNKGKRGMRKRTEEGASENGGSNRASERSNVASKGGVREEEGMEGGKLQGRYSEEDTP